MKKWILIVVVLGIFVGKTVAQTTNFLFVSSPQSFIGQGQSLFATPTNGYNISLYQIAPNIVQFNISATNSVAANWFVEFSSTNDVFIPGAYSNAVSAGGTPARFIFGGMGRGDNVSDGFFNIIDATYSSTSLVSFAADFVQFDNGNTNSWNEGSIRYNSTIPDSANLLMAPVSISIQNGQSIVTWSTNLTGFQLEFATNMPATNWFTNTTPPAIVNGQFSVTAAMTSGTRLFRLVEQVSAPEVVFQQTNIPVVPAITTIQPSNNLAIQQFNAPATQRSNNPGLQEFSMPTNSTFQPFHAATTQQPRNFTAQEFSAPTNAAFQPFNVATIQHPGNSTPQEFTAPTNAAFQPFNMATIQHSNNPTAQEFTFPTNAAFQQSMNPATPSSNHPTIQ